MSLIKEMALPILGLIGMALFLIVIWLLKTSDDNKKAVKGKLKAYILLENKILWKGLCDYSDTKVRAPWNKGDGKNKEGDRIQVFNVVGEEIWYDTHPEKGWFQQTVPCAFFHEREIRAIFPPAPCNCGHAECTGKRVPSLTPSQLGLMEKEHITEATLKATMWVKEVFDQLSELIKKMPPAWITIVGFIVTVLALAAIGVLIYQTKGDVSGLKHLVQPPTP